MQRTGSCKTWAGEGDAVAGTVQSAADIEFYVDIDPATGAAFYWNFEIEIWFRCLVWVLLVLLVLLKL